MNMEGDLTIEEKAIAYDQLKWSLQADHNYHEGRAVDLLHAAIENIDSDFALAGHRFLQHADVIRGIGLKLQSIEARIRLDRYEKS